MAIRHSQLYDNVILWDSAYSLPAQFSNLFTCSSPLDCEQHENRALLLAYITQLSFLVLNPNSDVWLPRDHSGIFINLLNVFDKSPLISPIFLAVKWMQ